MRYDYRVTADSYDFDETFDEIHPNLKSAREELRQLQRDTDMGLLDGLWYIERSPAVDWERIS